MWVVGTDNVVAECKMTLKQADCLAVWLIHVINEYRNRYTGINRVCYGLTVAFRHEKGPLGGFLLLGRWPSYKKLCSSDEILLWLWPDFSNSVRFHWYYTSSTLHWYPWVLSWNTSKVLWVQVGSLLHLWSIWVFVLLFWWVDRRRARNCYRLTLLCRLRCGGLGWLTRVLWGSFFWCLKWSSFVLHSSLVLPSELPEYLSSCEDWIVHSYYSFHRYFSFWGRSCLDCFGCLLECY